MERIEFYTDDGHGWLRVDKGMLSKLGIAERISEYSYMNGSNVYLEEDVDAGIYIKAYEETHPDVKLDVVSYHETDSFIRRLARYEHS